MKIKSSFVLLTAVLLMANTSCKDKTTEKTESKNERPNILFIMSDDHTAQAWGIYGGILKDYVHNPNIKRLAAEGCVL